MRRSISLVAVLLAAALLAACGSTVPLNNNVPVDDRSTASAQGAPADAASAKTGAVAPSGVTTSAVQTVNLGDAESAAGAAAAAPVAQRIVYFDYDSYSIAPPYQAVVEAQARYLLADRKRHVVIAGNTDERGGREYNLALGQRRADAVRRALTLLGVSEDQVETISFGKEKLVSTDGTEEGMAKNRRAEFNY